MTQGVVVLVVDAAASEEEISATAEWVHSCFAPAARAARTAALEQLHLEARARAAERQVLTAHARRRAAGEPASLPGYLGLGLSGGAGLSGDLAVFAARSVAQQARHKAGASVQLLERATAIAAERRGTRKVRKEGKEGKEDEE